jgi:hypothetical protein
MIKKDKLSDNLCSPAVVHASARHGVPSVKWSVSLPTHTIKVTLEQILSAEWKGDGNSMVTGIVPKARRVMDVESEDGFCAVRLSFLSYHSSSAVLT